MNKERISRKSVLLASEPNVDGVFRHIEQLAALLIKHDIKVHYAYSSRRRSDRLESLTDSIKEAGGKTIDLNISNGPSWRDLTAFLRLVFFYFRTKPDVVHGHASKAGFLIRLIPGARRIYTPHAYYGMGLRGGIKEVLFNFLERIMAPFAATVCLSTDEEHFARKVVRIREATIIYNCVNFDVFRPAITNEEKESILNSLGADRHSWIIGSVGRISYQKNPALLYHAFRKLCVSKPEETFTLLHVGAGDDILSSQLCRLAYTFPDNGKLLPIRKQITTEQCYRIMDVFCLTSRYEGMPYTVLEAMASNLPLVLTDVPGLCFFNHYPNGLNRIYFGTSENDDSIFAALGEWFDNRYQPPNHRKIAMGSFSEEIFFQKHSDLYFKNG
ncbi:MAG: glycosyltransferase [Verrucomicrobiota bacterium]